jgi:hypothetical protein
MNDVAWKDPINREPDPHIRRLIAEEMESMLLDKESIDLSHPRHSRELNKDALWRLARQKVIGRLADPTCGPG